METYKIEAIDHIQNYISGGRAEFVVNDPNNDLHITFKVSSLVVDDKIVKYFVRYKSMDWIYIGYIDVKTIEHKGTIYNVPIYVPASKKSKVSEDQILRENIFDLLIKYIFYIEEIPTNIQIMHTGRCAICGRTLTDPESIRIGIGPHCRNQ